MNRNSLLDKCAMAGLACVVAMGCLGCSPNSSEGVGSSGPTALASKDVDHEGEDGSAQPSLPAGLDRLSNTQEGVSSAAKFDSAIALTSDLEFSVKTPSALEIPVQNGNVIELEILLTNRGDTVFTTSDMTLRVYSAKQLATTLGYETPQPLVIPANPVGSGQESKMRLGFSVADPNDVTVLVEFKDLHQTVVVSR